MQNREQVNFSSALQELKNPEYQGVKLRVWPFSLLTVLLVLMVPLFWNNTVTLEQLPSEESYVQSLSLTEPDFLSDDLLLIEEYL